MFDFEVTNNKRGQVNLADVIGKGTVILCHAVYPGGELPYYQYLGGLGCRIAMVASTESPVLHMMPESHNLTMETYTDPALSLLTRLKQHWHLDMEPSELAKILRFQILIHNGEIVAEWRQPISDHWTDFLSEKRFTKALYKQFGHYGLEWLNQQDKSSHWIWECHVPVWEYAEMGHPDFDLFFKHYRLMPNEELENKLVDLKQNKL